MPSLDPVRGNILHNNISHDPKRKHDVGFIGTDLKIFIKDISDNQGRKRPLMVKTWSTIKDIKDDIRRLLYVPQSAQRLYFGPLMATGSDLPNHRRLNDAGIYRSGETLLLKITGNGPAASSISILKSNGVSDVCVSPSLLDVTPKYLRKTVQQARRALTLGLKPDLVLDGSGGTYILRDARKAPVAVFKPADEEPYAENNPRGYLRHDAPDDRDFEESLSMRGGIKPGEACLREVAAFLLDHKSFSGVPLTTLAESRHPAYNYSGSTIGSHHLEYGSSSRKGHLAKKVGSFQEFVPTECSMDDLSPSKISIDEVQKIAILDIRIMNADRNSANLLCRRNPEYPDTFELIPIDHGYCLRSVADVCWFDWCWLDWPQLKEPLTAKSLKYIRGLDIEADVRMLRERLHISSEALDYFRASSKLLQAGAQAGLTLYEIAVLCCRNDNTGEVSSRLECLMSTAKDVASSAVHNGRWHHADASQALAQQLCTPSPTSSDFIQSNLFPQQTLEAASSISRQSPTNVPPTAMHSSASDDCSSDSGDGNDNDGECDEWAAAFIATKLDAKPTSPLNKRQRAYSIISSDSEGSGSGSEGSSSQLGFWCVPPGSTNRQDSEEVSWSPHPSPTITPNHSRIDIKQANTPKDLSGTRNVKFEKATNFVTKKSPSVQVNQETSIPHLALPQMKRSQSYSGTTFKRMISNSAKLLMSNQGQNSSTEKFRVYLMKFIDLLVTREVTKSKR